MIDMKIAIGDVFGELTVIDGPFSRSKKRWGHVWYCRCSCGKHRIALQNNLLKKSTVSCGHYLVSKVTSHGLRFSPEYSIWITAKQRCFNPKVKNYCNYGGRGIAVEEPWKSSFETFYRDMGPKPYGYTLERINNDGNYAPGNCKWATRKEQRANQRPHVLKSKRYLVNR